MSSAQTGFRRLMPALWLAVAVGVLVLVATRLGVFALSTLVETADGPRWLANAFAGVDHPFHIARAEVLRRTLLDGELLRWMPQHQGGYPVEFYPLGVAWLEVAVWASGLGTLSIPQVHTIVIALIFLLPGAAYAIMARQDGWPPRVAVVALVLHVVVPGDWWHGGYTELVQWGLVTNVAGAVAALFCLAWLSQYVASGAWPAAIGAALAAAVAVYSNPRSLIALVVAGAAVWLAAVLRSGDGRSLLITATSRVGVIATIGGLLAAPELLSLARFSELYQFVRYERYVDLGAFLQSAVGAVSAPVLILAVAGAICSLATYAHPAARSAAIGLLLYAAVTILLVGDLGAMFSQLEPTRLMPFQRLLTVYLAAAAIELAVRWLTRFAGRWAAVAQDGVLIALVIALLVGRVGPTEMPMPVPAQTEPLAAALYPVERAGVPQQVDFEAAVRLADAEAAPGSALLVLGSTLSWHQRLWAPLWTERPLLYDNWLWFWHDAHAGTPGYVWSQGHHYPDPAQALDPAYLERHGIGAVVVTGPVAQQADAYPWLEPRRRGVYDVFLVREPTEVVRLAGANPIVISQSPHRVTATGTSAGGVATIRLNWYPRWQATVNGEPAPVARTDDGTMSVPIPPGQVTLELNYGTDMVDWVGRALVGAGLAVLVVAAVWRRRPDSPIASALGGTGSDQARGQAEST